MPGVNLQQLDISQVYSREKKLHDQALRFFKVLGA